jgi:UPF0755 protein
MTDRRVPPDDDLDPPEWVNTGASSSHPPGAGLSEGPPPPERRPRRPPPNGRSRREAATPPPRRRPPSSTVRRPDDAAARARTRTLARGQRTEHDGLHHEGGHDDGGPADPAHTDEVPGETRASRRAAERAARAERKRRRRRNFAALAIVASLVVPFLVVGGWFVYQLNPPGGPGTVVQFEIEDGWGTDDIGNALERDGVIGSSLAFQLYVRVRSAGPFQDGPYQLRTNLGVRDAVEKLETGPTQGASDLELTVPPGLTLAQIADKVAEQLPGRDRDRFLEAAASGAVRSKYQPPEVTSLEGLLFPDTYRISREEDEVAIVRRLVETFDLKADQVDLANAAAAIGRTPYEAITAASLIEREAGVEEDRPLISAVIVNRLRDGMPLQIDATLCFIKGGCTEPLTNADKELDSPYNTYKVAALPPGPISGVSEASLRASVAPADVPYKFYVLFDESGAHKFAVTNEEHDANVREARAKGVL